LAPARRGQNPMPGGHAWSADGTAWSNITLRALGGAAAVRTAAAANSANTGGGAATARGAAAAVSASTGSSAEHARIAAAAASASTGRERRPCKECSGTGSNHVTSPTPFRQPRASAASCSAARYLYGAFVVAAAASGRRQLQLEEVSWPWTSGAALDLHATKLNPNSRA